MSTVKTADSKGRVTLPGFANATVIVEAVSANEYRVRKARVVAEDDFHFPEEDMPLELSERDARMLLEMIENPSKPNAALRRAAKRYKKKYG